MQKTKDSYGVRIRDLRSELERTKGELSEIQQTLKEEEEAYNEAVQREQR